MGWWWWSSPATVALYLASGLLLLRLLLSFRELLSLLIHSWKRLDSLLHAHQSYKIPLHNDFLQENPLHRKASAYLSSLPSLEDSNNALLFSSVSSSSKKPGCCGDLYLRLDAGQTVQDSFLGAPISWTKDSDEALILKVRKQDRRRVLRPYLQHIEAVADDVDLRRQEVRLFTNSIVAGDHHIGSGERRRWKGVPFAHPSTMDTLAMDPDLKNRVKSDLDSFLKNKHYYHRLGRVWKRSYLLFGPPGTGKSSFIAAMAKFLCYDVYDLDLSRVSDGSDLKALLLQTSPRSVIVIEDLDRYLERAAATDAGSTNTLSAVLNFMDGIFSCCGEERMMVFTMRESSVAGMDPAVLRPGRLDVHLHFPLCDFTAFKSMASSYLGIKEHKLYPAVEEIFQSGASISPAEIGEIMIANKGSPSRALKTVINALQQSSAAKRVGGVLNNISGGVSKRRLTESASWSEQGGWKGGEGEEDGTTGVLGSNGALNKEFKKLYGLIKMRGGSRKEGQHPPPPTPPLPPQHSHHHQRSSSSSSDLPPASLTNSKDVPPSA